MPGTILEDITRFLLFIKEEKIEITGNKGLLPNYCLSELNKRMSHSLQLKRELLVMARVNGVDFAPSWHFDVMNDLFLCWAIPKAQSIILGRTS